MQDIFNSILFRIEMGINLHSHSFFAFEVTYHNFPALAILLHSSLKLCFVFCFHFRCPPYIQNKLCVFLCKLLLEVSHNSYNKVYFLSSFDFFPFVFLLCIYLHIEILLPLYILSSENKKSSSIELEKYINFRK